MSLFFRRAESRAMESWLDSDGFVRQPSETRPLYLGPALAAIRHIVDYGSTLPADFFRRKSESQRVKVATPQLFARLDAPGGIGVEAWLGQIFYSLAVHGNAVGFATELDGYKYPLSVSWLQRSDWSWSKADKKWRFFGAEVPFARVVHIPWIVPPGERLGLSPIEHYASITQAGLSAQEYADMRRGGGLPPAVMKNSHREIKDRDKAEEAGKRLARRFASGEPFVHGNEWDLSFPTIPPNHAQFIETLKLTANQIAAIYGIDPTEIGGQAANSLTYSTEELRQIKRASDMRPYITRVERAINRLLPNKQYMQLNVDAIVRTDIKTRIEVEKAELEMGTRSVNEIRVIEDRPPVKGGDYYNVPAPKRDTENTRREGDTP